MSRVGIPLDAGRLYRLLEAESWISRIEILPRVGSTNDFARELAREGAGDGTVVLADEQWAGRGRLGRGWHSPASLGLYVSVLFRPPGPPSGLTHWTLAGAVAACTACRSASGRPVAIEWPNDLVWQGAKLGGVLAELRSAGGQATDVVLGAGINVFHEPEDFPEDLRAHASSLRLVSPAAQLGREELATGFLTELGVLVTLLRRDDGAEVLRRWEALAWGARGRRVRLLGRPGRGAAAIEGITDGVDARGALRVRRDDGGTELVLVAGTVQPVEP